MLTNLNQFDHNDDIDYRYIDLGYKEMHGLIIRRGTIVEKFDGIRYLYLNTIAPDCRYSHWQGIELEYMETYRRYYKKLFKSKKKKEDRGLEDDE